MITMIDITERKFTEKALRESERAVCEALEFNKSIINTSSIGILTYDATGQCIFANAAAAAIAGTDVAGLLSQNFHQIQSWKKSGMYETAMRTLDTDREQHTEVHVVTTFGKDVWLDLRFSCFRSRGEKQLLVFTYEITERKLAEIKLHRALRDKDTLLKEVHHRVKNNLQIIRSLLNLQAAEIDDPLQHARFEESRDRVDSIALVHEQLYRSESVSDIDFASYLRSLVHGIAGMHGRPDITAMVETEAASFDLDLAIPCGLIVNELVSNSFKHAFPTSGSGNVRVGLVVNTSGEWVLTVEDNGVGIPPGVDLDSASTLGLKLVAVLAGQLHGTVELSRERGSRFSIVFPGTSEHGGNRDGT